MVIYESTLTLRHRTTMAGGFRHCCNGVKTFLICHVIHKDHMIKWSCNFITRSPLQKVITLPDLVAFLMFHVISCDHVFEGLCDVIGGSFLQRATNLLSLGAKVFLVIKRYNIFNSSRDFI